MKNLKLIGLISYNGETEATMVKKTNGQKRCAHCCLVINDPIKSHACLSCSRI